MSTPTLDDLAELPDTDCDDFDDIDFGEVDGDIELLEPDD